MSWVFSGFADEAGDTAQEQIQALQRAGMKHVDLRTIDGHNISVLPVEQARQIAKQLSAAGIKVGMFGSPLGKIDIADDFNIDLDKLRHMAMLKGVLHCNAVRIFSYFNKGNLPYEQWRDESLRRLIALRDLAAQLGMVLYHENERHIFGERLKEVKIIANEVRDGVHFKLIFDFDNYNQAGDDTWQNWLALRDVTDGIHLKDSARGPEGHFQHTPVGQGSGKVRDILADAVARQWSGPVSLEPHLRHSKAVMATGPSGKANEKYAEMPRADCFHIAATTALELMKSLRAPVV